MGDEIWDSTRRLAAGDRYQAQSAEMGAAVTEAVVDAARLAAGLRVLDVACGSGEPSLSMAMRLQQLGGASNQSNAGHVVGVDMAAEPLRVARLRARTRELANVEYVQGDVHALSFPSESFDRVTSRLGVMFFADLGAALREMHRVLRPGGRVALLAWGAMEQPYFEATIGSARRLRPELEIPPTARRMFQYGSGGVLAAALREAGFNSVHEEMRRLNWDWHGSPEQLWDYFRCVTVPFHPLLEKIDDDTGVEDAILAALGESYDGEYVRCQAQMVMATAER